MGLALDEPKADDERIEVGGFSFIIAPEVAKTIRSYENLSIDYMDHPRTKGFQLTLLGKVPC
jgi:Fe-S cluster assembly iron-binding protein IscA